jgi:hypothetical protein
MPPKKGQPPPQPKVLKIPELSNAAGFLRIRNGIWEHIKNGRLTANDWAVYITILHFADWQTGICTSNAQSLAAAWGDFNRSSGNKTEAFQNAMQRLRKNGYIDYPEGNGKRGNFAIFIDKAEPTKGILKGWRLRLVGQEPGSSDFSRPHYQYVSPTPMAECYSEVPTEVPTVDWRVVPTEVPVVVTVEDTVDVTAVGLPLQDVQELTRSSRTPDIKKASSVRSTDGRDYELEFLRESGTAGGQRATASSGASPVKRETPPGSAPPPSIPPDPIEVQANLDWHFNNKGGGTVQCRHCERSAGRGWMRGHLPNCPKLPDDLCSGCFRFVDQCQCRPFDIEKEDDELPKQDDDYV